MIIINQIGKKIKNIRKEKNITLQDLAKKTDLSVGYLSKLERDLTSPTILNLHKICNILKVTINNLLEQEEPAKICVKKSERQIAYEYAGAVKYELTTAGNKLLSGTVMAITSSYDTHHSYGHSYTELGIILEGSMEMIVDGVSYILEEGDTMYIEKNKQHSFRKLSQGDCVSHWTKVLSNEV